MTPKFIRDEFGESAEVTAELNGFVLSVGESSFWLRTEIKGKDVEAEFPLGIVDEKDRPFLKEDAVLVLRVVDAEGGPGAKRLVVSFVSEERSAEEIEAAEIVGRKMAEKLGWIDGGPRHDG